MAERRQQGNVLMEKEEASEDELEQSNLLTKNDAACREEDGWHSSTAASTCAGGRKSSRTLYSLPLQLQQRTCILSVEAGLLNPINDIIVPQRQLDFRLL